MKSTTIRISLLDDHLILLQALADRINAEQGMQVVSTASTAEQGLRGILETCPDIAILDVELPGRGVFDIAGQINVRQKQTKILFLTGYLSDVFIEQALKHEARGYLMKGEPIEYLIDCIRRIDAGEYCFSEEVARRLEFNPDRKRYFVRGNNPLGSLTSRQLEVLRRLAKGESVKEVAKSMHISQKSVDSHKYRIMHMLGIHDRVTLARYAIREGLTLP